MSYKINFKDSNCQYVEDYNAGKYGTKVKIYFCEGDGCCPKQYSGSVGAEMITADTIEELKLKLDKAVANRDKEIAKTLTDSKKVKDVDYTKKELLDAVMEAYGFNKKEANEWIKKASEGAKKAIVEGFKGNAKKSFYNDSKKVKDSDYPLNYYLEDLAIDSIISNDIIKDFDYFKEVCSEEGYDVKERDYKYYSDLCKDYNNSLKECKEDLVEIAKSKGGNIVTDKVLKLWADNWKDLDKLIKAEAYYRATNNRLSKLESDVIFKDGKGCVGCKDTYEDLEDCDVNFKDTKFKDASADEIIDLFHEAYAKGRTWDWLKNKLPDTFLYLANKRHEDLFPIQADRTGKLRGVHLTKPKKYSENEDFRRKVDNFIDDLDYYISYVQHMKENYNIDLDTYNWNKVSDTVKGAIENIDSRREYEQAVQSYKNLRQIWSDLQNKAWLLDGIDFWDTSVDKFVDTYSKGENALKSYIYNKTDKYYGGSYLTNQRKPIIYNNEGNYIRSDSKVGPLTPEAEAYIRKIMRETTTEEIESKRQTRNDIRRDTPIYFSWRRNSSGVIPKYGKEMDELQDLLRELKSEQRKESKMDINVSNRKHGYYKYTGEGNYDYRGNYKRNGGYEYSEGTLPTSVSINVAGLKELESALNKILNSGTVEEVEQNLQKALEVTKKLPRNNPRVAEIKSKIKALIEKRANAPIKKRSLPDKRYVKDAFTYEENKEYMKLCRQLGLDTYEKINKFIKAHGNVKDKELLEVLRKEVKKLK